MPEISIPQSKINTYRRTWLLLLVFLTVAYTLVNTSILQYYRTELLRRNPQIELIVPLLLLPVVGLLYDKWNHPRKNIYLLGILSSIYIALMAVPSMIDIFGLPYPIISMVSHSLIYVWYQVISFIIFILVITYLPRTHWLFFFLSLGVVYMISGPMSGIATLVTYESSLRSLIFLTVMFIPVYLLYKHLKKSPSNHYGNDEQKTLPILALSFLFVLSLFSAMGNNLSIQRFFMSREYVDQLMDGYTLMTLLTEAFCLLGSYYLITKKHISPKSLCVINIVIIMSSTILASIINEPALILFLLGIESFGFNFIGPFIKYTTGMYIHKYNPSNVGIISALLFTLIHLSQEINRLLSKLITLNSHLYFLIIMGILFFIIIFLYRRTKIKTI